MQLTLIAIYFENLWTKKPQFKLVVQKAWNEASTHSGPSGLLFHKLKRLASGIALGAKPSSPTSWFRCTWLSRPSFALMRPKKIECFFVDKWDLKKRLKRRVLGLTTFKSACKGQCSRITNLNEGYVNILTSESTIEEEEQKNIHRLKHGPGWVTIHEHKEVVVQKHLSPS